MVLTRHLDERTVEATASGTLRLPSELPDVARAIHWRAFACVEQVKPDPGGGRVEASGRVRVWVVYTAAGSEAADPAGAVFGGRLEGDLAFTARADVGAFGEAAVWDVRVRVNDVDGRFRADARTADVDVVLQLTFAGIERTATSVVTHASATAPCRVESATAHLRAASIQSVERTRISLVEGRDLPVPRGAGRVRILAADAAVAVTRAQVEAGGVAVEGSVSFELLYTYQRAPRAPEGASARPGTEAGQATGEGAAAEVAAPGQAGPEEAGGISGGEPSERGWEAAFTTWTSAEPFRLSVPVGSAQPGHAVRARAAATDVVARAAGEGRVELTVEVQVDVAVYATRALQVVTDIRGCEQLPVEQRKVSVAVENLLPEARRSFAASGTLELPAGQPPVERVLWCGVHLEPHPVRVDGNRAFVSASATPWMYYVPYKADARTGGLAFVSWPAAISVEQAVPLTEVRPQGQVHAWVSFSGVSAEADLINRQTVECSVAGTVVVSGRQWQEQEVVAEAVALQLRTGEAAPFFYLVVTQPGDTLWKLSRRYETSPESLAQANPELSGLELSAPLPVGRKLFVYRQP